MKLLLTLSLLSILLFCQVSEGEDSKISCGVYNCPLCKDDKTKIWGHDVQINDELWLSEKIKSLEARIERLEDKTMSLSDAVHLSHYQEIEKLKVQLEKLEEADEKEYGYTCDNCGGIIWVPDKHNCK